jgi:hypothetical protein
VLALRGEQRFWAMIAGMAGVITFEDFASGAWVAGSFGVLITIMTFLLSYVPKIRFVRGLPYQMPPREQVSALVGNREIRFCDLPPTPHDVHVWQKPAEFGFELEEYACMGHMCHHPERHV